MKKCRITVIRRASYPDLMEKYENPMENACEMKEGQVVHRQRLAETGGIVPKCMGNHVAFCYDAVSWGKQFL